MQAKSLMFAKIPTKKEPSSSIMGTGVPINNFSSKIVMGMLNSSVSNPTKLFQLQRDHN